MVLLPTGCEWRAGPPAHERASADTLVATPLTSIGEVEGSPEYLFGEVSSVAAGPGGHVYVADRIASTVRIFDRSGVHRATIGRRGGGPGEFTGPNDLVFDQDGRLYVRDETRIALFARSGAAAWPDSVVRTRPLSRPSRASTRANTGGGHYYYPSYHYFMFVVHSFFYEVFDSTGATGDTIPVRSLPDPEIFGRANYPLAGGLGGQPVEGVNTAPFEAKHSWAINSRGHVIVSPGDRYELVEWSPAGDTVRVVRFLATGRRVPEGEWRDSAEAFRARTDTIPVPLDEVRGMSDAARAGRLPRTIPEVLALRIDREDRIWVRRWPPEGAGDETFFDVIGPAGEHLGTVRIPAPFLSEPAPWVSAEVVVGVVRDPATGIDRVAVFELPHRRLGTQVASVSERPSR